MGDTFLGRIYIMNERRLTGPREISLPAQVVRREGFVFIDAGPLGSVMCHRSPAGAFEGIPYQGNQSLSIRLIIRHIHDHEEAVRLFFDVYPQRTIDPTELPGAPFVTGNVHARASET